MSPEIAAEPSASLFERYRGQEVTYKGVTGTLESLIQLCPVPHEEMDPQRIEVWSANILRESGIELPPELDEAKKKLM